MPGARDGPGRKADEALFVATYLATQWQLPLTVVTVEREKEEGKTGASSRLERARAYLEKQGVQATYLQESGDPARAVLLAAEAYCCNVIVTGGYESGPLRERLFGSTVDRILRSTKRPVLICR